MRKVYVLGLVFAVLLLTACSNSSKRGEEFTGEINTWDGVTMTTVEGTAHPGSVTVEILNTTPSEIDSGNEHDFALQVEQDGKWYVLERKKEFANTAEALIFSTDSPVEMTFMWASSYGSLPKGHYRVIKGFFEYRGPGDHTDFLLAAEFTLE